MPTQHRKTIAKEIVEETLNQFKKQREAGAGRQSPAQEVERKPEELGRARYAPSASFCQVFSGLMGERLKANESAKISEGPKSEGQPEEVVLQTKEDETEHMEQSLNDKPDPPQVPQKIEQPNQKEENISKPAESSVFEKLSRRANVS